MQITLGTIRKIVGKLLVKQVENANSLLLALDNYGERVGLDQPHRIAQFLPQALHESGAFIYDRELWGPTPAQEKYDTRTDLGNTPQKDGDGKLRAGRGPFQLTGGTNEKNFTTWARKLDPKAPDFYKTPDKINTDPWEGLSALWYWDVGNPEKKSLNRYADQGDIEMITRRINGGLNGYQDRLNWYAKTALVLLGYKPNEVAKFQKDHGLFVDGASGPKTRAAMHKALLALTAPQAQDAEHVQAAPVVEVKEKPVPVEVPIPVKVGEPEKPWYKDLMGQKEVVTTVALPTFSALMGAPWQNVAIIAGLCAVAGGAYYIIRKREKAKQEAQVQAINTVAVNRRVDLNNA